MPGRAPTTAIAREQSRALSDCFYDWELRGRGWQTWNYAVDIEPPFRAISFVPAPARADFPAWHEPWADPAELPVLKYLPFEFVREDFSGRDLGLNCVQLMERLRRSLSLELVASSGRVHSALTVSEDDAAPIENFLTKRAVPGSTKRDELALALKGAPRAMSFIDLGLAKEFFIPLPQPADSRARSLPRVLAAMKALKKDESAILQILIKPVRRDWSHETLRALLGPSDDGIFADAGDLVALCRRKVAEPLFAVILRVAGIAQTPARAAQIAQDFAKTLQQPPSDSQNALIVLPGKALAADLQRQDFTARTSHRSGIILNASELADFISLSAGPPVPLAQFVAAQEGAPLGEEIASGVQVRASTARRLGHMLIAGEGGRTKTSLAAELILHDLEERSGVALIDCDGTLADAILRRFPRHRLADVTLVDSDTASAKLDFVKLLRGGVLLARLPAERIGRAASEKSANLLLAKFRQAIVEANAALEFERSPFFLYVNAGELALFDTLAPLFSSDRKSGVAIVLIGHEPDRLAQDQVQIRALCRADADEAVIRVGRDEYRIEVPPLEIEPVDAGQRVRDVIAVSARRHGGRASEAEPASSPKIARLHITPEEAAKRASALSLITHAAPHRS